MWYSLPPTARKQVSMLVASRYDWLGKGFTVAFLSGRLSDHNLLDDKYVYRLRMMSGSLSKAMEQGIYTFITTTEKPRELVIADSIRYLAEQGDLTSALIRGQQMLAESQVQFRPARIGRRRW